MIDLTTRTTTQVARGVCGQDSAKDAPLGVPRLKLVNAVAKSLVSLMRLDQLLTRIVEAAVYVARAEEGFLLLVDAETQDLYLRAGKNLAEPYVKGFRIKVEDSLAGQVVKTGRPIRCGGNGTGRHYKVKTGYLVKSLLHVPLALGDTVIGVLSVDNKKSSEEFTKADEYMLSTLAGYAAVAVNNATVHGDQLMRASRLAGAGALATGVAHDLKNLFTVILGEAQLGLGSDNVAATKEALTAVIECVRVAEEITGGLLTCAAHQHVRMEMVDVREVVQTALQLILKDLQRSDIEVVRRLAGVSLITCDPAQMSQVCLNLFTNARDAMLPGGGTLTVEVKQHEEHILIVVSDTGCGIPDRILATLFEPFVTTKRHSRVPQMSGNGLGLYLTHAIVTNHGGTIEVETEVGVGSTFTVRLPVGSRE